MSLSAAQRSQIQKILATFRRDVRGSVKKHKKEVITAIGRSDEKKSEQIKRQIQSL